MRLATIYAVLGLGCGPVVGTSGETGAATSGESTAGDSSDTSTSASPDPSTPGTVGSSLDPQSTTGSSESSGDESSTTDPFACGCPENTPIEFDSVLERGFTPAEAVAQLDGLSHEFVWSAYPGQPITMLHIAAAYAGGSVAQGPGGSDGCAFTSTDCPDGVVVEIELTLTSDDGWLAWTMPATLTGVVGERLQARVYAASIGDNAGSLAMQPLVIDRVEHSLDTVLVFVEREEDPSPYVQIEAWLDAVAHYELLGATTWP